MSGLQDVWRRIMKIKEAEKILFELFPKENAMSYDNVGLLVGDPGKEFSKAVLTLDCTMKAVEYAKSVGAELIISHHPLIFGGINNILSDKHDGRIITALIKNDIALIACHTNLDMTDEFGNIAISEALGGKKVNRIPEVLCGHWFTNPRPSKLSEYALYARDCLKSSGVITLSDGDRMVSKVFVQGGAFDEDSIPYILEAGCDTVISGEIKHHICVLLEEYGVSALILGHSATEQVYLPRFSKVLEQKFKDCEIFVFLNNEKTLN